MNLRFFDDPWRTYQPDQSGMADFWDRRAASFNAHKNEEASRAPRRLLAGQLAERAGLGPESHVLDIGCGAGHYALLLARLAADVVGVDVAPTMI